MVRDVITALISQIGSINSGLSLAAFVVSAILIAVVIRITMKYQGLRVQFSRVSGDEAVRMAQSLASNLGLPLGLISLTGPELQQIVSERLKYKAVLWRNMAILGVAIALLANAICFYTFYKDDFFFILSKKPNRGPVANWTGETVPSRGLPSATYSDSRSLLQLDEETGKKVFNFSKPGDYLEVASDELPYHSSQRSIVAWVKYRSEVEAFEEQFIAGYGEFGRYAATYLIDTNSSSTPFFSNWGDSVSALNPVNAHSWHQIVAATRTFEGAAITALYVDGRYQTEKAVKIDTPQSRRLFIGGLPPDIKQESYPYIDRQLDGEIKNVSIYDYSLSKENIKYLYENPQ